MKKLNLKKLKLNQNDLLQRNELKAVFGGYDYSYDVSGSNCHTTSYSCANGGGIQFGYTCDEIINGAFTNVLYEVNSSVVSLACQ